MMTMWPVLMRFVAIVIAVGALPGASALAATNTIVTVAGTGAWGAGGDGGLATAATFDFPISVAAGADGTIFVADGTFVARANGGQVRRIDSSGRISTLAALEYPMDIAAAQDGSALVASSMFGQAWRVSPAGAVTTIVNQAAGGPTAVAQAPDGSVIVSDGNTATVKRIDPAGVTSTVAGTGTSSFYTRAPSGDGGPATAVDLNYPTDVALTPDGSILIADRGDHRVRRVDPAGVISTVAGNGTGGFSGDGGPATAAQLSFPEGVAVAPDGSVLIADSVNNRIRRVDPAGVISTLAGTGAVGFANDGWPATVAALHYPSDVAVTPDGTVLIADSRNRRIRSVDAGLVPATDVSGTPEVVSGDGERTIMPVLDVTAPRVSGSARRGRRGRSARRIKVRVHVTETSVVDLEVRGVRRRTARAGSRRGTLVLASKRLKRVRGSKTQVTTITVPARLLRRTGSRLTLRVVATDRAGNRRVTSMAVRRTRR